MRITRERMRRFIDNNAFRRQYEKEQRKLRSNITTPHSKLAVVIHLFYTENWPLFSEKLKLLKKHGIEAFDLFLTIPVANEPFMAKVAEDFPGFNYMVVPNRGRDVLPFVKTFEVLKEYNYEYILKFHSKKSTHWEGGKDWLTHTMEVLIPQEKQLAQRIIKALDDEKTGVIGPAEYYYPLTINFPANGPHMTHVVTKLYGAQRAHEVLQEDRKLYGFFGGTMFWGRLDAIDRIIDISSLRNFESEKGQIDATYAHALERLFCVVPEIDGKKIYELTNKALRKRSYESDNIPEWSTDHDK